MNRKHWIRGLLLGIAAAALLPVRGTAAVRIPEAVTVLWYGDSESYLYRPSGTDGKSRFTALGSSDRKVLKVKTRKAIRNLGFVVTYKKPGTAKVSFRYGGRPYEIKYTVRKYESPCKSFKIGSRNYTSCFKETPVYNLKSSEVLKGRLQMTPRSGWKVVEITDGKNRYKNKEVVTLDPSVKDYVGSRLAVTFRHKKTKEKLTLSLGIASEGMVEGPVRRTEAYEKYVLK